MAWAYVIAVVATTAVVALRLALRPLLGDEARLLLFIVSVLAASWAGGLRPGLLAVALAVLAGWFFFSPPARSLRVPGAAQVLHLALFAAVGVLISGVFERLHAYRRRADRQAELLNQAADAVLGREWDGTIVYWNRGAERLYGYTRDQAIGRNRHELLATENSEPLSAIEAVLERNGEWAGALSHRTADGRRVRVQGRKVLVREPDGRRLVLEIDRDTTALLDAEAALRRIEERFRLLAETIPQLAWIARPDGHVLWFNRRWYDYTGIHPDEAEGWGWPSVHDPGSLPAVLRRWRAALAEGEPFEMILDLRGADGRTRPFLTRVAPLRGDDGQILSWFGTNTDITEIRAMERSLRASNAALALLAETASYLLTVDEVGTFLREVYQRLRPDLGLDLCFGAMINDDGERPHLDFCDGLPTGAADRLRAMEFGQAVSAAVARGRRVVADDREGGAWAEALRGLGLRALACFPLLVRGALVGTLGLGARRRGPFHDDELALMETVAAQVAAALDRRLLVERLRDRAERLAEADRQKDEFLATLAHELRNPLAPLRNGLDLLRLADDPAARDEALEMMERQVGQMVRLIDDLLDVSRISRGKIELRRERLDLATAVRQAVEAARPTFDARRIALALDLEPGPIPLDADPTRLAQVLGNLLNNAVKFTPPGGRVAVAARRDGDRATIRVRDDGVGIPPEVLPRIFDLFVQADQALDRSQGGLGIGLTLVRRLAELHGGAVEARSEGPGRGSEFLVTLPVAADPPREVAPAATTSAGARPAARDVLVVDDNRDSADSLADVLRLLGHRARVAYDGPAALELIEAEPPELVICDVGMPGMSGLELAHRLRGDAHAHAPTLVALTGFGSDADRRRILDAGFDLHVVKPLDLAAVRDLLERADVRG